MRFLVDNALAPEPAHPIDSPRAVVFQQVENRLHTEQALVPGLLH